MNWLAVSRPLTVVGSIIITLGLYHQAGKIWSTRSVDDFSTILVISLIVNEAVWLNYGMALSEWPIILISGANIPAVALIAVGHLNYRKNKRGR